MDISVRQGEAADAEAIGALTREAYAKWIPVTGGEPMPMRVDYAQAVREHRFDLLYAGEELAALIETTPQGQELLIVNVAVRPGFQGRGLGVRLLRLADDLAAASGLAGTRLYTNRLMAANIALYERFGYRREREEVMANGTAVHMVKPLAV